MTYVRTLCRSWRKHDTYLSKRRWEQHRHKNTIPCGQNHMFANNDTNKIQKRRTNFQMTRNDIDRYCLFVCLFDLQKIDLSKTLGTKVSLICMLWCTNDHFTHWLISFMFCSLIMGLKVWKICCKRSRTNAFCLTISFCVVPNTKAKNHYCACKKSYEESEPPPLQVDRPNNLQNSEKDETTKSECEPQ